MVKREVSAIDCEGVPEHLYPPQLATSKQTLIFDSVSLGAQVVCSLLRDVISDANVTKLFLDLYSDAFALARFGGIQDVQGSLDTQIASEVLTENSHVAFNDMLKFLGHQEQPTKKNTGRNMNQEGGDSMFKLRPLPSALVKYAAQDVELLLEAYVSLCAALGDSLQSVKWASDLRFHSAARNEGRHKVSFHPSTYRMMSSELLVTSPEVMVETLP